MAATVYGIKNCSTVKKALGWLDQHGVAYQFHDYKKTPATRAQLEAWCAEFGWDKLINRAGTSFRALPDEAKQNLDQDKAIALMLANNSLIKRPLLDDGDQRLLGFVPGQYQQALNEKQVSR